MRKKSELPTCFNFVSMFFIVITPTSYCLLLAEVATAELGLDVVAVMKAGVEAVMEARVAAIMEAGVGGCHCVLGDTLKEEDKS